MPSNKNKKNTDARGKSPKDTLKYKPKNYNKFKKSDYMSCYLQIMNVYLAEYYFIRWRRRVEFMSKCTTIQKLTYIMTAIEQCKWVAIIQIWKGDDISKQTLKSKSDWAMLHSSYIFFVYNNLSPFLVKLRDKRVYFTTSAFPHLKSWQFLIFQAFSVLLLDGLACHLFDPIKMVAGSTYIVHKTILYWCKEKIPS